MTSKAQGNVSCYQSIRRFCIAELDSLRLRRAAAGVDPRPSWVKKSVAVVLCLSAPSFARFIHALWSLDSSPAPSLLWIRTRFSFAMPVALGISWSDLSI